MEPREQSSAAGRRLPLVVGITGLYGSGRSTVADLLSDDHGFRKLVMSDLIREKFDAGQADIVELQRLGDEWRRNEGHAAVALAALSKIRTLDDDTIVVDGLKHPQEVEALRSAGDFYVLSIQARTATRKRHSLGKGVSEEHFRRIDEYDQVEKDAYGDEVEYGQRAAYCLPLADLSVWNDTIYSESPAVEQSLTDEQREEKAQQASLMGLSTKISAVAALLTGATGNISPYPIEVRMSQAYAAAGQSSCLKRKVGAVITNDADRILAEGYNEVPGGQSPCFEGGEGKCFRDIVKSEELETLTSSLIVQCKKCGTQLGSDLRCTSCGIGYAKALRKTKHLDCCRALHAEESALLQVSRHGGMGVEGGTIYTTTFPCALCAKKIVAVGITMVVFAEMYDVPEAEAFLVGADVQAVCFEGVTHRALHRLYR